MRVIKQLTNFKHINIKEIKDTNMGNCNCLYAERDGVNSVAFICYDKFRKEFLLIKEPVFSIGKYLIRAFGGSLDKNVSLKEIVQQEVEEEAGYRVDLDQIHQVGKYFVSNQMNEFCFLYLVFVDNKDKIEKTTEYFIERLALTTWMKEDEVIVGNDWKSILILNNSKASSLI